MYVEHHLFPESGGFLDQPSALMEVLMLMEAGYGREKSRRDSQNMTAIVGALKGSS